MSEKKYCLYAASNVQSIDVSYNSLDSTGVELLLTCLRASCVTDLDLTATVRSYSVNHVVKHVAAYCQAVRLSAGVTH